MGIIFIFLVIVVWQFLADFLSGKKIQRRKRFLELYEKVPVILVGNKVDLESEREVSSSEGRALAEEWGCPFMETSAKSKTMVDELFAEIVRQMNYAAQPDKDDPCCSACNIQ
ncbi:PREDICTED: ras-related protein Rap-2a-like [Merops nubicus]|uniref:ras-related protein Rap-2a-like n=1 Tax=Merops nubicus TaxID=57421 RepID=UPI0004F0B1B7|nr:PREDICTED: ras-related protein Rap-2a-like [Merops nubicus]